MAVKIGRKQLVESALELNKNGVKIKNPRFMKSQELEEKLLNSAPDSWDGISAQTMQVLLALGANVPLPEEDDASQVEEVVEAEKETDELPTNLYSREAMEIAARDMNDVMGLEPGIDTTQDDEHFRNAFVKAASMADVTDTFTDYTWAVLTANGLGPERKKEEKGSPKKSKVKSTEKSVSGAVNRTSPSKGSIVGVIRAFLDARYADGKAEFSKDEIVDKLVAEFPERSEKSMRKTLSNQISFRKYLPAKGYSFENLGGGKMKIISVPA